MDIKYVVNEQKRIVVCVMTIPFTCYNVLSGVFKGIAKCSPDDSWNLTTGCDVAYTKALLKLKKAEVSFHKSHMAMYKEAADLYNYHSRACEFNQKRVKEVQTSLSDLTA